MSNIGNLNLSQALDIDVQELNQEQAEELFGVIFEQADRVGHLNDADDQFEAASNDELPNVLRQSIVNSDLNNNVSGSRVFDKMLDIVLAFPDADFSA